MSDDVLTVSNLTMRFGGLTAVSDLSFAAKSGAITAIIGPNGAGKTTLFNCLTGFYRPTQGNLRVDHANGATFDLESLRGFEIARDARIVRTFQNIRLFSGMSVLENLLTAQHTRLMRASLFSVAGILGLSFFRKAEKDAVEKARYWLDRVGLTQVANDAAGSLPYGAQRRLEIARAMCAEPVLLCLDEPAAGLNPRESEELSTLLLEIRRNENIGILLIEHDMRVVMQLSDFVVVLDHGVRIAEGTPDAVRANPAVISAYLGAAEEA